MTLTPAMTGQPAPAAAPSQLADPAAYAASQFGTTFKLDPNFPPMFGDLDGDGKEDLVLVGTSSAPLVAKEEFSYKVEDPYDSYYGVGDTRITSQFTLHFDGSARCLLIVFDWRQSAPAKTKGKPKLAKFVLINTPFERVSMANLRFKKKNLQAIEAVDRTTLHALVFWNGRRWVWDARGMADDDSLFKMPPPN